MKRVLLLICCVLSAEAFSLRGYSDEVCWAVSECGAIESYGIPQCLPAPCYNYNRRNYWGYIGIDGGWGTGLSISDRDLNSGPGADPAHVGITGMGIRAGYHVGANLGFIINPYLRTDISYTFLNNSVTWASQFGAPVVGNPFFSSAFKADLFTHLILWNGYVHLNRFCGGYNNFSPYLAGGVGVAINDLQRIDESDAFGHFFATVSGKTHSSFGARFGIGFLRPFCRSWALDMGFNIDYIGSVWSGNTQVVHGVHEPIAPYRHAHNWMGVFYVGLKYGLNQ